MKICAMGASCSVCTNEQTDMTELIVENSGLLRSEEWYFLTDVSGQPIVPIQGILEYGTDWLSRNAGKELPLLAAY